MFDGNTAVYVNVPLPDKSVSDIGIVLWLKPRTHWENLSAIKKTGVFIVLKDENIFFAAIFLIQLNSAAPFGLRSARAPS